MNMRTIEKQQIVEGNRSRKRQEKMEARKREAKRRKDAARQQRAMERAYRKSEQAYGAQAYNADLIRERRAAQRSGRDNFKNTYKKR